MKKVICILIFIIILLLIHNYSYAGDEIYHFMNKDQEHVIIGKIIKKTNNKNYTIEVSEIIEASSKKTKISKNINVYSELIYFEEGEYIAISIDKVAIGYKQKWGVYKITTDDTDTLEVIPKFLGQDEGELAAIEVFLRSRGRINCFYFPDDGVYMYSDINGTEPTEDDICIYNVETGKSIPVNIDKNEKNIINQTKNYDILIYILGCGILFSISKGVLYLYTKKRTEHS